MKSSLRLSAPVIAALTFASFTLRADNAFEVLHSRFSGTTASLHGAAFGTNAYVAVGEGGTILWFADTVKWESRVSGTTNRLKGVQYGPNGFIAVGEGGPGARSTILASVDGIQRIPRNSPVTNALHAVCYWAGLYVVVGSRGMILTSTDGNSWTSISTGAPNDLNGVDAARGGTATSLVIGRKRRSTVPGEIAAWRIGRHAIHS